MFGPGFLKKPLGAFFFFPSFFRQPGWGTVLPVEKNPVIVYNKGEIGKGKDGMTNGLCSALAVGGGFSEAG